MSRLKILLTLCALILAVTACAFMDDAISDEELAEPTESSYVAEATEETEETIEEATVEKPSEDGLVCPVLVGKISDVNAGIGAEEEEPVISPAREETTLVSYAVNGDEISDPVFEDVPADLKELQANEEAQRKAWNFFIALIPAEYRTAIVQYRVFTDGVDNTLASVAQTEDDPNLWALQVDAADLDNYYFLTTTLLHEYAHLLSLNSSQAEQNMAVFNDSEDMNLYDKEEAACSTHFTPMGGCLREDSYLNAFYNQFWTELNDEWRPISRITDPTERQNQLDAFYAKYEDQFPSAYAVTSPEEDFAESWSVFMINPKPQGESLMEKKAQFFYDYPELVEQRANILANLCEAFPQYQK